MLNLHQHLNYYRIICRFNLSKPTSFTRKTIILFFLFFSIINLSFSQTKFIEGYIITLSNDTIYGMIDYKRGILVHHECNYKKAIKDTTILFYSPKDIKGYGFVLGGYYEGVLLDLYQYSPYINFDLEKILTPDDYQKFMTHLELIKQYPNKSIDAILGEYIESPIDKQKFFLKVLVTGDLSLYKYGNDYFLANTDEGLYLFQPKTSEEIVANPAGYFSATRRNTGILRFLMAGCPEVFEQIEQLQLKDKHFIKLLEDHSYCINSPIYVHDKDIPWVNLKPGFTIGYNSSRLFTSKNRAYSILEGETLHNNQHFISGLSLEIEFPRNYWEVSLLLELNYFASQYSSTIEKQVDANRYEKHQLFFQFHELQFPLSVKYTISQFSIKPYMHAGFFLSYHINTDSYYNEYHRTSPSTITYKEQEDLYPFTDFHFGFFAGAGLQKNIINNHTAFFEIRYLNSGRFVDLGYPFGVKDFDISKTHLVFVLGVRY